MRVTPALVPAEVITWRSRSRSVADAIPGAWIVTSTVALSPTAALSILRVSGDNDRD